MTRHEKLAAWTFTGAAVVNVVANYLLIPRYGAQGAAAATAASVALVGLGMWIFARRHFPGHAGSEVR
jgi:O-antigen/teichoic acid export membrane protein